MQIRQWILVNVERLRLLMLEIAQALLMIPLEVSDSSISGVILGQISFLITRLILAYHHL